ncbi:MAG: glycosyltransferase [Acidobacteriota bacterium]|nr:glycosyltransferase [Acidobacteriota bacterium]
MFSTTGTCGYGRNRIPKMDVNSTDVIFQVDVARLSTFPATELSVKGWNSGPDRSPLENLWVTAGAEWAPCLTGLERSDLAVLFGRSEMGRGGFTARIPMPDRVAPIDFYSIDDSANATHVFRWDPPKKGLTDVRGHYEEWLARNERGMFWPGRDVMNQLHCLRELPLISVVLPTYETQPYHLYRCVHSVITQRYPNWELLISDDASYGFKFKVYLDRVAAQDKRIQLQRSPRNGGISSASNLALARARGEWTVLLDHDDELHPYALIEVVRCLNRRPETDLIYSDEDKIDQAGNRSHPAFKPDFDPDLLLSFNYIGHLVCARTTLVQSVGGFRKECDGAQDWDLLLRMTEQTGRKRIRHIAKPLYHWRMHAQSTSMSLDSKPYAQLAWPRVLNQALERRGLSASAEKGLFLGSMRVKWEPQPGRKVAVITRLEDGTQSPALLRCRRPENLTLYEQAFSVLRGAAPVLDWLDIDATVVVFINGSLDRVNHFFLEELASQADRPDCGMVGGIAVGPENRMIAAAFEILREPNGERMLNPAAGQPLAETGYMGLFKVVRQVASVSPLFFAARAAVLKGLGGVAAITAAPEVLCERLAEFCYGQELRVVFTPYAIGTLSIGGDGVGQPLIPGGLPDELCANPNAALMPDPLDLFRYGI